MLLKRIGVIGAGQMGGGIAQVAAVSGFQVIMCDISEEILERGLMTIRSNLERLVKKEILSAGERQAALNLLTTSTGLDGLAKADFVVEAATENTGLKLDIFRRLDNICRPGVILASNTSSISITKIAGVTLRPESVIGMHFMNPVPLMKLVEVINGLATSGQCTQMTVDLAKTLGKVPVQANDYPGFVSNRVLMPMINEAVFCLMEGVGQAEDIDQIMMLGMNHPMGPLALADLIGLDTCLSIMEVLHHGLGDSKYRPCPLIRKYVDQGWLGRKSGRGFYDYPRQQRRGVFS